jgi:hypothetical protein
VIIKVGKLEFPEENSLEAYKGVSIEIFVRLSKLIDKFLC